MQIDAKHFIANNYDEYVEKAIVLADKADRNDDSYKGIPEYYL